MQRAASLEETEWIASATRAFAPVLGGEPQFPTVASCVPPQFPANVKIFHPIYEDLSVRDRNLTWDKEEKSNLLEPVSPTDAEAVIRHSTLLYSGAGSHSELRRISWAALAERYGVKYGATLNAVSFSRRFGGTRGIAGRSWPRYLIGPAEGCLENETRDEVAGVIDSVFPGTECYFHFWI